MPSAIEAPSESTMWISRSGSMSRAIWALLIVPDSVPATWIETIASAPAAKAASYASLKSPGDEAAVVGNGASGATIRSQKAGPLRSTPALKVSLPKLTSSGTTWMPGRRGLGRVEVRRRIGEDRDATQGVAPPQGPNRRAWRFGHDTGPVEPATGRLCSTWIDRCGPCWPARSRCASAPVSPGRCWASTWRPSPNTAARPSAAIVLGVFGALFYLAELVLSPIFGILSDRQGHHRVMLYGPIFGAVAVIMTGFTADLGLPPPLALILAPITGSLVVLGVTRVLEGASTAASIPSILGYIAMVTAGDELLRGKAAARFEGATLLGLGRRVRRRAGRCSRCSGRRRSSSTPCSTASRSSSSWTVKDPAGDAQRRAAPHVGFGRYLELLRSSHVWLLAPTWIAVNASIGLWFSQSIFQFATGEPGLPGPGR